MSDERLKTSSNVTCLISKNLNNTAKIEEKVKNENHSTVFKKVKEYFVKHNFVGFKAVKILALIIAFLVIVVILFSDGLFSSNKVSVNNNNGSANSGYYTNSLEYAKILEDKLSTILAAIKGAGKVDVMISFNSSLELVLAGKTDEKVNSTTNGNNNSTNTTTQNNPIILNNSTPFIISEILPTIKGVVVVSAGASDVLVRYNLIQAVKALLDIPSSNIQIFSSK